MNSHAIDDLIKIMPSETIDGYDRRHPDLIPVREANEKYKELYQKYERLDPNSDKNRKKILLTMLMGGIILVVSFLVSLRYFQSPAVSPAASVFMNFLQLVIWVSAAFLLAGYGVWSLNKGNKAAKGVLKEMSQFQIVLRDFRYATEHFWHLESNHAGLGGHATYERVMALHRLELLVADVIRAKRRFNFERKKKSVSVEKVIFWGERVMSTQSDFDLYWRAVDEFDFLATFEKKSLFDRIKAQMPVAWDEDDEV